MKKRTARCHSRLPTLLSHVLRGWCNEGMASWPVAALAHLQRLEPAHCYHDEHGHSKTSTLQLLEACPSA